MDTSKLVVGQQVELVSGAYSMPGTVASVTPDALEVRTDWPWFPILHFDGEGNGKWGEGTADGGDWYLADLCPHARIEVGRDGGRYCLRCTKRFPHS
jgi:hypothetical protein